MSLSACLAKFSSACLGAVRSPVSGSTNSTRFNVSVTVSYTHLIGINLYYVALIGFGLRVFINVGAIRKIIMTKRF